MFKWIREYLTHKESLRSMRREDALWTVRYEKTFWDKVYADTAARIVSHD